MVFKTKLENASSLDVTNHFLLKLLAVKDAYNGSVISGPELEMQIMSRTSISLHRGSSYCALFQVKIKGDLAREIMLIIKAAILHKFSQF